MLVAHLEEGEEEEEGLCCQVSLKYCKGIFLDARSFSWVFVKGKSFAAFSSALSFFLSAWDSGTERERESRAQERNCRSLKKRVGGETTTTKKSSCSAVQLL